MPYEKYNNCLRSIETLKVIQVTINVDNNGDKTVATTVNGCLVALQHLEAYEEMRQGIEDLYITIDHPLNV